ncbi:hypothetical protein [Psittacicella hinzii]|nr:hypothetical protein [Psittacicella hinzii]
MRGYNEEYYDKYMEIINNSRNFDDLTFRDEELVYSKFKDHIRISTLCWTEDK